MYKLCIALFASSIFSLSAMQQDNGTNSTPNDTPTWYDLLNSGADDYNKPEQDK